MGAAVEETVVAEKISRQLLRAMEDKEFELDQEIARLEQLDGDDLELIRQKRKLKLIRESKRKNEFLMLGHGTYTEVTDEMDFFNACRQSAKVVCHFYKADSNLERKEILDKHLIELAKELIEIRFLKANVERLPFVSTRLQIHIVPTIIFVREQQIAHTMLGFQELGGLDNFERKEIVRVLDNWGMMTPFDPDWRLYRKEVVEDPDNQN